MQLGYQPLSPGKTLFPQWTGASTTQGATPDTFITDHQLPPENTVPYEDHGEHVPAYRLAPNETGFWFSHPASAECPESMAVGYHFLIQITCPAWASQFFHIEK